jgi:phage shock protein C
MEKQLRRIKQGSVLGGVAGGLAHYFQIDVVIVRLLFVVSLFVSFGVSLFAYIVLWVVLPEEPYVRFGKQLEPLTNDTPSQEPTMSSQTSSNGDRNLKLVAIGLIAFGTYLLLDQYIVWYTLGKFFWPMALIGIGAFLLLRKRDLDSEVDSRTPEQESTPTDRWASTNDPQAAASTESGDESRKESPGEDSFKVN